MVAEPAEEERSRGGGQRAEHEHVGQVQGPLQLSSTAKAWKEALGEVDVGRWDLIYRQGPVPWSVQGPVQCPVQYLLQCLMAISPSHLLNANEADRQPSLAQAKLLASLVNLYMGCNDACPHKQS